MVPAGLEHAMMLAWGWGVGWGEHTAENNCKPIE